MMVNNKKFQLTKTYSGIINSTTGAIYISTIIIEEGEFNEPKIKRDIKNNWDNISPVTYPKFSGLGNGKFKISCNSNVDGLEEIHLTKTLKEAKAEFELMVNYYCVGLKETKNFNDTDLN